MPNIIFKVGSVDLSSFVRVNPDQKMSPSPGDVFEPAFSDSPLFEGQTLTSLHAKNKEMAWPLFLHPPTPPYTQDALNLLIQQVNQALRPVVDLGQTVYCQWQNAQASNPTFFTVQFGRFEPDFNFRITEKGWLAGILHLWVLPYGHTATERAAGTWSAPTAQSGIVVPAASIVKGALRTVPQVGATNLLPNPSFEYDASGAVPAGWSAVSDGFYTSSGASCAAAPSGFAGTQAMRIFGATSGANTGVNAWIAGPFAPGVTYVAQVMMRGASGGENIAMGIDSSASRGDFNYTGGGFIIGTQWQNVAVPWTPSGIAATAGLWIRSQTATGITIWADAGIVSTPSNGFFDGDTAAGFWGATPGFSYSALAPTSAYAVAGDVSPQFDLRVTVGSYLGDDGRVGIMTALPQASYAPIIPVGSFLGLNPSAIIYGASGAWASQFLAFDNTGGSQGAAAVGSGVNQGYFSLALSPASVYAGDNRVLGLVRARQQPFGLRAFDPQGIPLGPTAIASALDGWQLIDYGVLRLPPWQSTALIRVEAYSGIPYSASGMFSADHPAPGWTKEHGPVFVIPNGNSVLDLDWNSQTLSMDGFDGAAGAILGQDQLGNSWSASLAAFSANATMVYLGNSQAGVGSVSSASVAVLNLGSGILNQDHEIEGVFTLPQPIAVTIFPRLISVGRFSASLVQPNDSGAQFGIGLPSGPFLAAYGNGGSLIASAALSGATLAQGVYGLRLCSRGSQVWANLIGPSGVFSSFASGVPASVGGVQVAQQATNVALYPGFSLRVGSVNGSAVIESFRARTLASQGYLPRDILHLHQPLNQNTRMTPSALDVTDMQARQRGPVGALSLPVPSLGAGLFVASFPWDQGPANDLLNVDVRIRERFTYAR